MWQTASPMSSLQSPTLPSGIVLRNSFASSGYSFIHQSMPVDFARGIMQFTKILSGPHSTAAALDNDRIDSLTAAYAPYEAESGLNAEELAKLIIFPSPFKMGVTSFHKTECS